MMLTIKSQHDDKGEAGHEPIQQIEYIRERQVQRLSLSGNLLMDHHQQ